MKRRSFLKSATLPILAGNAAFAISPGGNTKRKKISMNKEIQKRPLGKTGEELSFVGFGGIVVSEVEQTEANEAVAKAVECGINYFDVAPTYGNAEDRLGPALEPFRKDCFLACKTTKRDKEGAAAELRNSLKNLRTDHFDLYQLHALSKMEDVEQVLGPNGALEAFVEARNQGLIRFIGFSAHSAEASLRVMEEFDFDTILFPTNFVTYYRGNFGPEVFKKVEEKQMGHLAIKALARCPYANKEAREKFPKCWYQPITDDEERDLALRWSLSQGITAAIPPGDPGLFWKGVEAAQRYRPLTTEELSQIQKTAAGLDPIFSREA